MLKRKGELVYVERSSARDGGAAGSGDARTTSYITRLWNNEAFRESKNREKSFIHPWSRHFTVALFNTPSSRLVYWQGAGTLARL